MYKNRMIFTRDNLVYWSVTLSQKSLKVSSSNSTKNLGVKGYYHSVKDPCNNSCTVDSTCNLLHKHMSSDNTHTGGIGNNQKLGGTHLS